GWESVGDMGYLDDDGYLYLGDRRSDMILSGGRNIYPAEIEAAIERFPGVQSSAVIGLPDADLGQAIHAILECEVEIDEAYLDFRVSGIDWRIGKEKIIWGKSAWTPSGGCSSLLAVAYLPPPFSGLASYPKTAY
ncbi:MAG: hypothetical protein ACE1Z6_04840, partial [Candidatus Methylomirabilales bacterium]